MLRLIILFILLIGLIHDKKTQQYISSCLRLGATYEVIMSILEIDRDLTNLFLFEPKTLGISVVVLVKSFSRA